MKKLIGLPLAAIMMAGLLSLASPPAANASCVGPYTAGCNPTEPEFNLRPVYQLNQRLIFPFEVVNTAGNRDPRGYVWFRLFQLGGAGRADASRAAGDVVWKKRIKYNGDRIRVRGPKLDETGQYRLVAKFKAPGKKPFKTSKSAETFRVRR